MKFQRRLCRNGNSMMITIPPQVIDTARWRPTDPLILEMPDMDTLVIRRAKTLDDINAPALPATLDTTVPPAR